MFKLLKSLLSISFLSLIVCSAYFSPEGHHSTHTNVSGFKWADYWVLETDRVTFSINIEKTNKIEETVAGYRGRHCWSDRLAQDDCASPYKDTPKLYYTLSDGKLIGSNILEFKFRTAYGAGAQSKEDYYGKIQLKVIDSNTIEWNITEPPKGRTPIPDQTTLSRQ